MKINSIVRKVWRYLAAIHSWQPLTLRGIAVLLLAAFALRYLAFSEHDLAANVVGVATAGVICAFAVIALLLRLRLERRVAARCRFDEVHAYSSAGVPSGIVLDRCSVLSFFELELERNFFRPGVLAPTHVIKGSDGPARRRYLIDAVRFPHRGLWSMDFINMRLTDIAGLVRLSWRLPTASSVEVAAPTIAIRPLPILVSSARAGDELSLSQERSGDPFDMKSYDPSDGVKRIMWKVYARSHQLVVRRPEPAVIPEGELALYLVAGRDEDYVAGALQGYLEQLEEEQITVLFGTDGLVSAPASGPSTPSPLPHGEAYCSGTEAIRRAIIHSVWSDEAGTGAGFASYINSLSSANRSLQRVVVFGPNRSDWLESVAAAAGPGATRISAVVVPDEFRRVFPAAGPGRTGGSSILRSLQPSELNAGGLSTIKKLYRRLSAGALPARPPIETIAARAGVDLLRCERR